MATLRMKGLRRQFGSVEALADFDLEVGSGELVTLLGPSGCGKTTLLRIVAGFEQPSAGQVWLEGEDITATPPNRRRMGMVFQAYSLFPNMTAEGNVRFGLRLRGLSRAEQEQRLAELFKLIGLEEARQRYPHQLSGGQQQRVALARALGPRPKVLLMDEPLSALDAQVRQSLRAEIRRIQQAEKTTTLFVTHDQEEALTLSDRVVVMNRGRIEQVGSPQEVYLNPATAFVAGFVGVSSVLEGEWAAGHRVQTGAGSLPVAPSEHPIGAKVRVFLRPENLRLTKPGEEGLEAHLEEITFMGSFVRLRARLRDGQSLWVDQRLEEAAQWQIGDAVSVINPSPKGSRISHP
jgi:putative spermidine/putrescine transport system ATP-binding protein